PPGAEAGSGSLPAMIVNAGAALPLFGTLPGIVLLVWLIGFLVLALRLTVGLAGLAWASGHARPLLRKEWLVGVAELSRSLKIARTVRVLQSANPLAMPLTWGIFRPLVILLAGASACSGNQRRIVLIHEFAPIPPNNCFLTILLHLGAGFHWFNPSVGLD